MRGSPPGDKWIDGMKRRLPFIFATILCLPLCVHFAIYLLVLALPRAHVPDLFSFLALTGLYWVSQWPGLTLLALLPVLVCVALAWRQTQKTRAQVVSTGIYSAALTLYFGVAIWCLVTRPGFEL
jgi:hypothetical protein